MSECIAHIPICGAECCKQYTITIKEFDKVREGAKILVVPPGITKDEKWYYELHGATFKDGFMVVTKAGYKKIGPDQYQFHRRCSYLTDDLRCKGHRDENFIKVCISIKTCKIGHNIKSQTGYQKSLSAQLLVDMGRLPIKVTEESGTKELVDLSIAWFGNITMEEYQKDIKYTTLTTTNSTIASRTYKWLMQKLTAEYTRVLPQSMGKNINHAPDVSKSKNYHIFISTENIPQVLVKFATSDLLLNINVEEDSKTDKPEDCQALTRETAHEERFVLTPNCVFRRPKK